jgi:hypothetical protein
MYFWVILLPCSALWTLVPGWPRWLVMTCIAFSILGVLKAATIYEYCRTANHAPTTIEILCWFFTWPGLNAREFWSKPSTSQSAVRPADWFFAVGKTLLGIICITILAPGAVSYHPLVGGWMAMIGIVLTCHFGAFHLLALTWKSLGREVRPIMYQPLLATSVGDFWSHRWNLAFRDFANLFVMRPLARRWNGPVAMWGCFAFSGLVHELAISVPARAGYGWPLSYFLLQAVGVSCERLPWVRQIGLKSRWAAWLFAFLVIGPPAFFLFHPPFVTTVILPLIGIPEPPP